jgi:hypothetical protein
VSDRVIISIVLNLTLTWFISPWLQGHFSLSILMRSSNASRRGVGRGQLLLLPHLGFLSLFCSSNHGSVRRWAHWLRLRLARVILYGENVNRMICIIC